MRSFEKVLVVGAGTMGAGIAEVAAKAGLEVVLSDVAEGPLSVAEGRIAGSLRTAVTKGKLDAEAAAAARARIRFEVGLEGARGADLLVEAAPESMELKKRLFAELSARAPEAVLATNTSSLSVTELAASVPAPERVIGLHFFNPPAVMPLLEIVRAEQTAPALVEAARALAARLGKDPIVVRDVPGFASSRLGVLLGLEAMRMLEQGVATAEDLDRAMVLGYRHPMGPLELTDLVGLDVRLAIADHLAREVGPQFAAPPILRTLVRAGKLGKKTGEGFYRWIDGKPVARTHR